MIQSAGADRESDGEVEEGHGFGHFYHEVSQRITKSFRTLINEDKRRFFSFFISAISVSLRVRPNLILSK